MDAFPPDRSEATTAAAIFCRILLGEDPGESEMIQKGAELCIKSLLLWDEAGGSIDMIYWYFGTLAMHQIDTGSSSTRGLKYREVWWEAVEGEILPHQRKHGEFAGSWEPAGAWGRAGGRVFATALMAMCLEAEYLYPRLFPARGR